MAFESLTERLQNVFKNLRRKGKSQRAMSRKQPRDSSGPFRSRCCPASCQRLYQESP